MPVLYIQIVLDSFYLLIFYSEKFSTWIWRLPFGVNVNLHLSNKGQRKASTSFLWSVSFLKDLKTYGHLFSTFIVDENKTVLCKNNSLIIAAVSS